MIHHCGQRKYKTMKDKLLFTDVPTGVVMRQNCIKSWPKTQKASHSPTIYSTVSQQTKEKRCRETGLFIVRV